MRRIAPLLLVFAACAALPPAVHASGTLKVVKNVAKAGTVTAGMPGDIECGLDCTTQSKFFDNDCYEGTCTAQEVGVSAAPEAGWTVTGYDGCSDGGDDFCMVVMSTSRTVTVGFADVGAPTVAIGGPVEGSSVRGTVTLTATAADNDSVSRVEFFAAGAKVGEDTTAPYTFDVNTAGLADGTHQFAVRSYDPAGHGSSAATRSLLVDNTKPAAEITGGTGAGELVGAPGDAAFTFTGSDATSGVAQMQCALDGGSVVPCDSATAHALAGLPEGNQKFLVRAVDGAGNVSDWDQRSFTVDKTLPTLEIQSGPDNEALIGKPGTVAYTFGASDANGVILTCAVDNAFDSCDSSGGHSIAGLADGRHSFSVRAKDGAGNQRTITRTFRIDTTAPTVTFTAGPADGSASSSRTADFTFAMQDASGAASALECVLDGAAGPCDSISSHKYTDLPHGTHTFSVRVTDLAGNTGVASRTFAVDVEAPETIIDTASVGAASAFTFSASEAGSTFACRLYKAGATPPAFGDCDGASGSHATSGLAAGDYVFEVIAIDAVGNVDGSPATRAFTVTPGATPGTTDPGTPDPGKPGAGVERIKAGVTWEWDRRGRRTRANVLNVTRIPAGAAVEVRCKGKGCPFAKKAFAYKKPTLKLARALKKKRMLAGATVEIRVVKPNTIGWVVVFKMRPKGQPTYRVLCLPAGATKPAKRC